MDQKAMIKLVKKAFPLKQYPKCKTLEDLAMNAGEQKVIRYLETRLNSVIQSHDWIQ